MLLKDTGFIKERKHKDGVLNQLFVTFQEVYLQY